MAESGGNDLLIKIGADAGDFNLTLDGLIDHLKEAVGDINPIAGAAVAAIAGIGVAAFEAAENFESAFQQIETTTGAEGTELDGLKQSFTDVFNNVPASAGDAATAIGELNVKLGLTGDALTEATTQFLNLSIITGEQVGPQIRSVTQALNAWQVATENQSKAADYLNQVHEHTGIAVSTLATNLAAAQPIMSQFGLSMEQTALMIGDADKAGVDFGSILPGFNKLLVEAKNAGQDTTDSLQKLFEAIRDAGSEADARGLAIEAFGQRAGSKLAEEIRDGKLSIDDWTISLLQQGKGINDTAAGVDNLSKSWQQLKNNLQTVLSPLGNDLVKAAQSAINILTDLVGASDKAKSSFADWEKIYSTLSGLLDKLSGLDKVKQLFGAVSDGTKELAAQTLGYNDNVNTMAASMQTLNQHLQATGDAQLTLNTVQQASKPITGTIVDGIKEHAAQVEALKTATEELSKDESAVTEARKSLYIPAILDLATAEANVNTERTAMQDATEKLATAEAALQAAKDSGKASSTTLLALELAAKSARTDLKQATDFYNESEKDLTNSKQADATITADLNAANNAISAALKATHIPAVMDYQTALAGVATTKQKVEDATVDLQNAELAESLLDTNQVNGKQLLAAAHDLVKQKTKDLQDATVAYNGSVKDLTASEAVNKASKEALASADVALDASYKLTKDTVTDVQGALDNYTLSFANAQQAELNLKDAEQALQDLRNTDHSVADEQKATENVTTAKKNLTLADKDLNLATQDLTTNFGLSKDAILLLKQNTDGAAPSAATLQAAYHDLGVQSTQTLQNLATAADQAYKDIEASGTVHGQALRDAFIADLTAQAKAAANTGDGSISAGLQIQLAEMKTKQADFITESQTQWGTMFTNIDTSVKNFASSAIQTLFTGQGSLGQEAMSMLEQIGESIVTTFTKKAVDAIASFIAGSITDLLSGKGLGGVLSMAKDLGTSLAGIFKSSGTAAAGAAANAGVDAASAGTNAAGSAASAASSAGSTASSVASGIMSFLGPAGAIGSILSGVTGVLQLFGVGQSGQKDRLDNIANDTRFLAWCYDAGNTRISILQMAHDVNAFVYESFGGWYLSFIDDQGNLQYEMNDRQKEINLHMLNIDTAVSGIPKQLDGIAASELSVQSTIQASPMLNSQQFKVMIDGNELVASWVQTMESNGVTT